MERFLGLIVLKLLLTSLASPLVFSQTPSEEKIYFYHTDVVGSPLAMTDRTGNIVWRADYMPFGDERIVTPEIENSRRFAGKEKDDETGLSYFGARFYEPKVGRFVANDPLGPIDIATGKIDGKLLLNPQRLNAFAYSKNNPYRFIDPDGEVTRDLVEASVAASNSVSVNREAERSILENTIRSYDDHKLDILAEASAHHLEKTSKNRRLYIELKGNSSKKFNQRFSMRTKAYRTIAKYLDVAVKAYQNINGVIDIFSGDYAGALGDFWEVIPGSWTIDMFYESMTGEHIDFQGVIDFWGDLALDKLDDSSREK